MSDLFNLDDMLDSYLYESRQLLGQLQSLVLASKDETHFKQSTIHKIFRTMHTMKSSAGIMMFDSIGKVAHKLEDVFSVIRESQPENVPHVQLVEYVLEVSDFISTELDKVEKGEETDGDAEIIVSKLDQLLEEIKSKDSAVARERYVQDVSTKQFYIAPSQVLEKPVEEASKPFIFIDLESSVEEIEARAERTQKQIMEEAKTMDLVPGDFVIQTKESAWLRGTEKSKFIQVDIKKMDQLVDIVEALAIAQNDGETDQTRQLISDLQDMIDSIRKVSLANAFQRMNRIVFDASRKLGKDINLTMDGKDIELDKNMAEQIADILMHLVRNAVDHGIESPQERVQIGKPSRGKIHVSVCLNSENVCLVVMDDGRGLNKKAIFEKAQKKEIIGLEKNISDYSDKEIYEWVTLPGFSTRETVSEFSGRGVGLDVVASNLASLKGCLDIENEEGKGCKMILQIPLRKRP